MWNAELGFWYLILFLIIVIVYLHDLQEKARAAMDYLWKQRHRTSDLMGTVLNIHNGDWIRRGIQTELFFRHNLTEKI